MKNKWIVIVTLVIFTSCGDGNSKLDKEKYENTKEDLEARERKSPLSFLTIAGTDKKNLFGQTVVRGIITNKASVCAYKDVRVKMLFYNNGTLVENHEEVLDETIKANNTADFKSKYFTPKGTDSVALSIMSAKVSGKE